MLHRVDTTAPGGTLVFHIVGTLAQFGRDFIRERTTEGLKATEARGRKGGRRPAVMLDKPAHAKAHLAARLTVGEATVRVKVIRTGPHKAFSSSVDVAKRVSPWSVPVQSLLGVSCNTVHFAIRMAALKSMRVVGCGVRGRNG